MIMDTYSVKQSKLTHIIKAQQFSTDFLQQLFYKVASIQQQFKNPAGRVILRQKLSNKLLFNLFYEPSTRTRYSFASAAHHMGMQVIGTENAKTFSSAVKGESIEDTIKVLCGYAPDAIVLRHHEIGSAEKAAAVSTVPIINAGDGTGQHPTQALLDVYTIYNRLKTLNNLTVLIGGDLAYGRTVRSLVYLLSKFKGTNFIFCSPEPLKMFPDIKEHLEESGVPFIEVFEDLYKVISLADVVYWTRIQKERIEDPDLDIDELMSQFVIDNQMLSLMKPYSVLMHPLPRNSEIAVEVDNDIRAAYFEQASNGMFVRMALLEMVLKNKDF
jgi:aspartate carbamoyltransferase catalytic subunit